MRRNIWRQVLLFLCGWLVPILAQANLCYWQPDAQDIECIDPDSGRPIATVHLPGEVRAVEVDSLRRAWVLAGEQVVHVSEHGDQDAKADLSALGLGAQARLRVDPFDGTAWLADAYRLVHIGLDGAVREQLLVPETLIDYAVGLDQSIWVLGDRTARQFDFRENAEERLVASFDVSTLPTSPQRLVPDSLNNAVWLLSSDEAHRFDLAERSKELRVALPAGVSSVALDAKHGALWVLTDSELLEIDKVGQRREIVKLDRLGLSKPQVLVPQPSKDSAWIGGGQAIAWIGIDGTVKRTVRFPAQEMRALSGPSFAVGPSISLMKPQPESVLTPGATISLGLAAECGLAKCEMPAGYFEGFRVESRLGSQVLPFAVDSEKRVAWHHLLTQPDQQGALDFSAVAVDALGHTSSPIVARYLGRPAISMGATATGASSETQPQATSELARAAQLDRSSLASAVRAQDTAATTPGSAKDALARLPIAFEPNNGQHNAAVKYAARGLNYGLLLGDDQLVLTLRKTKARGAETKSGVKEKAQDSPGQGISGEVIRKRYPGSRVAKAVEPEDLQEGKSHYLVGPDRSRWRTNVPRYAKVRYREVFPGIDQVYYGKDGKVEYDWIVHPGANPLVIRESFAGAQKLTIGADGDLLIDLKQGQVVQHRPVAYQMDGDTRQAVDADYVLLGTMEVGFRLGAYDKTRVLFIDPVITFATYLGGSDADRLYGMATDESGNVYLAGWSDSEDYPITNDVGSLPPVTRSGRGVLTKLNASGTAVIYSTYVSGLSGGLTFKGIAVDPAGNVYLAGEAYARDLPVSEGAFQTDIQSTMGSGRAGYVCKVSAAGNALAFATYIGGRSAGATDQIAAMAIDSAGNSYLVGTTTSADYPTTPGAYRTTKPGSGSSAFVTKLNATGSALLYSTFLGGTSGADDVGTSIAVDSAGNAFVGGIARTADFPTTADALRIVRGGAEDGFLAQLDASGGSLVWSTLLGGELPTGSIRYSGSDGVNGLALDGNGFLYATGYTNSTDFPVLFAHQSTMKGRVQFSAEDGTWRTTNAFLTKIKLSNRQIYYSTFLGGQKCAYCFATERYFLQDGGVAVAASPSGTATIVGYTSTDDFPILNSATPFLTTQEAARSVGFVAQFSAGGRLNYSFPVTSDRGNNGVNRFGSARLVAMDASENVYVGGGVSGDALLSTPGVVQPDQPDSDYSDTDGFVMKVAPAGPLQIRIASSANPAEAGTKITLMVSVSGGAGGLSAGWSWCDGDICTEMLPVSSGTISNIPPVALSAGSHNLTARYAGDGVNPPTVSPVLVQVVNDPEPISPTVPASTTSLQASSTTVGVRQNVTLTASIATTASFNCGSGFSAGQIELFDSGVPAGTTAISRANYTAINQTFTLRWLSPGTHYLTARYSGSPCAKSSESNPVTVTVDDFAPQVAMASPADGARFQSGSTITLAAVAASPGGRSITSVRFSGSSVGGLGTTVGTVATSPPYTTSWSKSLSGAAGGVPGGTYQIRAVVMDSSGVSVTSAPITIEVGPTTAIGESITYLHNDVTGNTVMATNESGTVLWKESYRPYGERLRNESASAANRQFFHGKAYDSESGLQYFGARYYDPVLGRFMGIDPQGFDEGNLQSFNRYAYGNNNPYRYRDPNGKWAEDIALAIPGLAFGAHSFWQNASHGNVGAAVVDALGMAADGIAAVVPAIPGGAGLAIAATRSAGTDVASGAVKGETALTSRAARREAMRDAGMPTSQQPISQTYDRATRTRELSYEVPAPGGGTQRMSVQQQTMDRSHPGQPHWEAGRVKTDPRTGEVRYNNYGRPALTNDKSKVDY